MDRKSLVLLPLFKLHNHSNKDFLNSRELVSQSERHQIEEDAEKGVEQTVWRAVTINNTTYHTGDKGMHQRGTIGCV